MKYYILGKVKKASYFINFRYNLGSMFSSGNQSMCINMDNERMIESSFKSIKELQCISRRNNDIIDIEDFSQFLKSEETDETNLITTIDIENHVSMNIGDEIVIDGIQFTIEKKQYNKNDNKHYLIVDKVVMTDISNIEISKMNCEKLLAKINDYNAKLIRQMKEKALKEIDEKELKALEEKNKEMEKLLNGSGCEEEQYYEKEKEVHRISIFERLKHLFI